MIRTEAVLSLPHVRAIPESLVESAGAAYWYGEEDGSPRMVVAVAGASTALLDEFDGVRGVHDERKVLVGPTSARNAAAIRSHLKHLTPKPIGLRTSFGFGDRLGIATPGHVLAMRRAGQGIIPIFAQQSARELTRTGRTAREVMDAATWGAFRQGWTTDVGADADHLKNEADVDAYLGAGFSMFTIDPGDHVGRVPAGATTVELQALYESLPWAAIEDSAAGHLSRYAGRAFDIETTRLTMTGGELRTAAIKYAKAVAHVTRLFRHLKQAAGSRPVELEVSVDETDAPTTALEHVYVASELLRRGIGWVSLAPRLVGSFEKGVDYIGDLRQFEAEWAIHASIARALGPYKLSLHSGSDKFSLYDTVARATHGTVHVKTAGTSWLEALRTIAAVDAHLFRRIYAFARERYPIDRASYHVSAKLEATPQAEALSGHDLPALLDDFHARQILHVTFGSVLRETGADGKPVFRDELMTALEASASEYARNLETHFARHLAPFSRTA